MKRQSKIKILFVVTAFIFSFILIEGSCAKDNTAKNTVNKENKTKEIKQDQTSEKREEILEEARAAIRETQNALKALDEKKKNDALSALEHVSGKLTIILARDPELALAPSDVRTVTYNILADIDAVKALREEIENALDDGRVQRARRLIRNLASETVVSVFNIPLITYPEAIKHAVRLIDDDKIEEAKQVLQTALNTLVITDTIIPLPVAAAEELLKEAETLTEKSDRSKEENKRLDDLLKDARLKLEFAQALGYGGKKDFKNLYEQLDNIEERTKGGKSGSGYFDKIKGYLNDAVKSSQKTAKSENAG